MDAPRRGSRRVFSYDEALATFPVVRHMTAAAVRRMEALMSSMPAGEDEPEPRRRELDEACEAIVRAWAKEIAGVGCEVKGLWLVDWDNGDGYYCWRFPEETVSFFHGYDEGFAGRLPIN